MDKIRQTKTRTICIFKAKAEDTKIIRSQTKIEKKALIFFLGILALGDLKFSYAYKD